MNRKKLQVFISSTYIDLKDERQAAVEAILSSGHMPAGMELFSAGDESQMKVIKRWIEESDVYLLILGGRYGSIESKSGKSYTQLEYEYAIELNKPIFSVVITEDAQEEKIKKFGSNVIEKDNPQKLKAFKETVLGKLVKFFDDEKDIKLAIHETMSDFSRRKSVIGWVRADQEINAGNLAEELARLTKENSDLRNKLEKVSSSDKFETLGLSIDDIIELLKSSKLNEETIPNEYRESIKSFSDKTGDTKPNLFHFFWLFKDVLANGEFRDSNPFAEYIYEINRYGIVEKLLTDEYKYKLTDEGRKFYLKCLIKFPY
jgi:hypothetical protein